MTRFMTPLMTLILVTPAVSLASTSSNPDNDGDGYDTSVDCDDNNAAIYPDASESCDGIDSDCDGQDYPSIGDSWVDAFLCGVPTALMDVPSYRHDDEARESADDLRDSATNFLYGTSGGSNAASESSRYGAFSFNTGVDSRYIEEYQSKSSKVEFGGVDRAAMELVVGLGDPDVFVTVDRQDSSTSATAYARNRNAMLSGYYVEDLFLGNAHSGGRLNLTSNKRIDYLAVAPNCDATTCTPTSDLIGYAVEYDTVVYNVSNGNVEVAADDDTTYDTASILANHNITLLGVDHDSLASTNFSHGDVTDAVEYTAGLLAALADNGYAAESLMARVDGHWFDEDDSHADRRAQMAVSIPYGASDLVTELGWPMPSNLQWGLCHRNKNFGDDNPGGWAPDDFMRDLLRSGMLRSYHMSGHGLKLVESIVQEGPNSDRQAARNVSVFVAVDTAEPGHQSTLLGLDGVNGLTCVML